MLNKVSLLNTQLFWLKSEFNPKLAKMIASQVDSMTKLYSASFYNSINF